MELYEYEEEFYEFLDPGESRCKGIRRAIDKALERQDIKNALTLYYIFIEEDTFECDGFQSFIIFPEYLAFFEKYPEYHDTFKDELMWAFKWILGSAEDFYQISLKQITDIYRQYGEYCDKFNYNKRSYYRHLWCLLDTFQIRRFPLISSVEEAHKRMMHCSIDNLSEPKSGEIDDLTSYTLFVERNIEKALKIAEPVLSGQEWCNVVPHYTYTNFADYYFDHGDLKNAVKYAERAVRIINRDFGSQSSMMRYKGRCISVLAFGDTKKALKLFRRQLTVCYPNTCGLDHFYFYRGAYHLFSQLEKSGQKTVRLKLPFKEEEIYKESCVYSVAKIKDFFYSKVKFYADKFDERDGNRHFNKMLSKKYEFEETDTNME